MESTNNNRRESVWQGAEARVVLRAACPSRGVSLALECG